MIRRSCRLCRALHAINAVLWVLIAAHAFAQQPDPTAAIFAEWQAMRLAQDHAAERINALIQAYQQQQGAYEARLATAIAWLKAAQVRPEPQ